MAVDNDRDVVNYQIACRWCATRGADWSVREQAGRGGTAPVFTVMTPDGERALKIYDIEFSSGEKGKIEAKRVDQQIELGVHDCPSLIKIYDGGNFENRLFLLMNRAPGQELEKRLNDVPRNKIRTIVSDVARACIFLREKGLCHRDVKSANIFVSDDFDQVTLLDLSVTRDIYDPVGIGTDHDGQLPVVATARYSPPEYLFRLLEPGSELWHALDVYQLGGLLHDLIMREPLFQKEYIQSKENRYRFAWIVATVDPVISAPDVDQDLIFTARRALDKNWERRSLLTIGDFLADSEVERVRAMDALGLSTKQAFGPQRTERGAILRRIADVASGLETRIQEFLRTQGVTARHFNESGADDRTRLLRFEWLPSRGSAISGETTFSLLLSLVDKPTGRLFESRASLVADVNGARTERAIELPAVDDSPGTNDRLGEQAEGALGGLATLLLRRSNGEE
jgi:serine/threonine protein kinase